MVKRKIKQHPSLDRAKPSLVEREVYIRALERLQKVSRPSAAHHVAVKHPLRASKPSRVHLVAVKRLQKSSKPSKSFLVEMEKAMQLRQIFEKHAE
jgi:hypothetical protein